MMEWYQVVSFYVANGIRLSLGLLFFQELLKDKDNDKNIVQVSAAGAILLTILDMLWLPQTGLIITESVILILAAHRLFHKSLGKCIFFTFFYETGIALWEFIISSGIHIFLRQANILGDSTGENVFTVWVAMLLMISIAAFFIKRQGKVKGNSLSTVIVVGGLLCIVALSEQSVIYIDRELLLTQVILAVLLVMFVLVYKLNQQHEMEMEIANLKQEQVEIIERDYQALSKTYADNAKLYHDLHNHIESIYQCLIQGDIKDAVKYCEDLRTPISDISQTVWTGDKAIDYLISSKIALAEQENIKTKVNIEYPRNTNIRSVDLTTILGNLLDNSLEALQTAPEHLRFLNLTVRRINDMLIIKVENGYGEAPMQENGKLRTSKTDKVFHGWGLKSVQTAAEYYDGTINIEYEDGVFKSVVTLSFQPIKTE